MKKIHLILTIGLTLFLTSAWAEKYEYVRIKTGQEPITLEKGDLAWWVNFNNSDYLYQYDSINTLMGNHRWTTSSATGGVSQISRTFIGPCKLGLHTNPNVNDTVTIKILRTSNHEHKVLEWDGTKYASNEVSSSDTNLSPINNPSSVQYDTLLGWCYFTDTPWLYSYTNGSWYYMKSINNEVYVWNANLPDGGWTKFRG
jgi:hypothetical protein